MKHRHLFLIAFPLLLSACSTIQELYTDVPQEVAAAQSLYATVEDSAEIYAALPACSVGSSVLCRDPAVIAKLAMADNAAFAALQAAYTAESQDALDAAQTAISAFENIVSGLPTAAPVPAATTN